MELIFSGAAHEVTGSCHCLNVGSLNILVDCGMEQGRDIYENQKIPFPAETVDLVLLTHAHIDHSGLLPLLWARGFRGRVYATEATTELCSIMLRDSAHIQEFEAEWRNRKAKRAGKEEYVPLYTMADAEGVLEHFVPVKYGEMIEVAPELRLRFTDIGHLLGSACIEVWMKEGEVEKKIVFSGDVGNLNQPIVGDPSMVAETDYLVVESTYGDRVHKTRRIDYCRELSRIFRYTFQGGGNVVIPSFAVGRTQEILWFIRQIKEENMLGDFSDFEVYVDSPLAIEATAIFRHNTIECYDDETMDLVRRGIDPISFPGLKTAQTSDESKAINFDTKPKVIISSSGMCEAGRIRHHLKHNLWRPESTILFVGYQAEGTLGRALVEGEKEVKLFGETIFVRANIEVLEGVSGHADKPGLIRWIRGFEKKPRRVFVVHGEDTVCDAFAACLREEYAYDASAPYSGAVYDLAKNITLKEGVPVPVVQRELPKQKEKHAAFLRLEALGRRLMEVIAKNEGTANKALTKFGNEVEHLCDKWDR